MRNLLRQRKMCGGAVIAILSVILLAGALRDSRAELSGGLSTGIVNGAEGINAALRPKPKFLPKLGLSLELRAMVGVHGGSADSLALHSPGSNATLDIGFYSPAAQGPCIMPFVQGSVLTSTAPFTSPSYYHWSYLALGAGVQVRAFPFNEPVGCMGKISFSRSVASTVVIRPDHDSATNVDSTTMNPNSPHPYYEYTYEYSPEYLANLEAIGNSLKRTTYPVQISLSAYRTFGPLYAQLGGDFLIVPMKLDSRSSWDLLLRPTLYAEFGVRFFRKRYSWM